MDYGSAVFGLAGVALGGMLGVLTEFVRGVIGAKERTFAHQKGNAETLAALYTEFMIAFQRVLMLYENYFELYDLRQPGLAHEDTEPARKARTDAANRFREALWRVRIRDTDAQQRAALDELSRAFDLEDFETFMMRDDIARDYGKTSRELRAKATAIVDRYQVIHEAVLAP